MTTSASDTTTRNATPETRRARPRRWLVIGMAVIMAGGATAAWAWLKPRRDVTTRSPEAYARYQSGMEAMKRVYMNDACKAWLEAATIDSTFAMAWMRLGRTSYMTGNPSAAHDYHARAERHMGSVSDKEHLLIRLLGADLGSDEEGKTRVMAELEARFPDDPEVIEMAAIRAFHDRRYEVAAGLYQKLLVREPGMAETYNMLGYTMSALGRWPEAVDAFQKYAFLSPDQANPHDSLGELYLRIGRYEDALAEFERAAVIKPDFGWPQVHSALVHAEMGRYDEAIAAIRAAVATAPDGPDTPNWSRQEIFFHLEAGRTDEALALARAAERAEPDAGRHALLARIHAERGEIDQAQFHADAMLTVLRTYSDRHGQDPARIDESPLVNCTRGDLAAARGDWAGAVSAYEYALKKTEVWWGTRRVQCRLMWAACQGGQHDRAAAVARDILATNPRHAAARYWLDRALGLTSTSPSSPSTPSPVTMNPGSSQAGR